MFCFQDVSFPEVAFFACTDIQGKEELWYVPHTPRSYYFLMRSFFLKFFVIVNSFISALLYFCLIDF